MYIDFILTARSTILRHTLTKDMAFRITFSLTKFRELWASYVKFLVFRSPSTEYFESQLPICFVYFPALRLYESPPCKMDQDTHQATNSLLLDLLLEDVNDEIDGFEAQLLGKETNQPTRRLEEAELDRGMALHIWKSEIERQRVILSDFQMATALSIGYEAEETLLPEKRTFISTSIQKIVHSLKNIMRSIKFRTAADSSKSETCTSCREIYSEVVKTQCSHFYCKDCLIRMVTKSLRDESLFPLQCCNKPIEGSGMKKMIGYALAQEQKKRETELGDPDRTYCSDSACSRYILPATKFWPSTFHKVCTCKCGVRTCRKCKKSAHRGRCLYQLDRSMERLMAQKKWQRCTKCGRMIELNGGCPHIT
jgi:hypothetical protein